MPLRGIQIPTLLALEDAVLKILNILYSGLPIPQTPLSAITPPKIDRNNEIWAAYVDGESVPSLAKRYGISKPRIYQILKVRRTSDYPTHNGFSALSGVVGDV